MMAELFNEPDSQKDPMLVIYDYLKVCFFFSLSTFCLFTYSFLPIFLFRVHTAVVAYLRD